MPTRLRSLSLSSTLAVAGVAAFGVVTLTDITGTGDATIGDAATDTHVITGDLSLTGTGEILSAAGNGSGFLVITGGGSGNSNSGAYLCLEDNDGAGYSVFSCINGTCGGRTALATECSQ